MLVLAQLVPPWVTAILIAVFLLVCLLMILVVLIQRPAGGGLSGAFGSGAGSGQTAFGAKTGDALTLATVGVFFVYLLFAVGLNYAARPPGAVATGEPGLVPPVAPIGPPIEEQPAEWAPEVPAGESSPPDVPGAETEPELPPADPGDPGPP